MTAKMPMPGWGTDDIHPTTGHALLRALLANDMQGAEVILSTNDPRALTIVVAGLAATMSEQAFGSLEALDEHLARRLAVAPEVELEDGQG